MLPLLLCAGHACPQAQQRIYYFLWQLYHLQQDEATALQQQQELKDKLEELTERNNRWGRGQALWVILSSMHYA